MQRRTFLQSSAGAGLTVAAAQQLAGAEPELAQKAVNARPFGMKFAPHFNMFRHSAGQDLIDQLKFAHDQGFRAWEDNGMKKRSPELQARIGQTMEKLDMEMGVFVAHGSIGKVTFTRKDPAVWSSVLKDIRNSLEVAKRVRAKWMTVVPGNVDENPRGRLAMGYQTANVIELLRRCAEILEPEGLVMVLEPLNWHTNHGGVFLERSDQAYAICKAVNSPACKILFDIYHQQITEGNLIPNIDHCWDEIGMFQIGDNPGRKEPTTGEIHYKNVLSHIQGRKWTGILGLEHGNSQKGVAGEQRVIAAYREVDPTPAE